MSVTLERQVSSGVESPEMIASGSSKRRCLIVPVPVTLCGSWIVAEDSGVVAWPWAAEDSAEKVGSGLDSAWASAVCASVLATGTLAGTSVASSSPHPRSATKAINTARYIRINFTGCLAPFVRPAPFPAPSARLPASPEVRLPHPPRLRITGNGSTPDQSPPRGQDEFDVIQGSHSY